MVTRRRFLQTTAGSGAVIALAACAPATTSTPTTGGASIPAQATWTVALDFTLPAIDFDTSGEWRGVTGHFMEPLVDTVGADFKLVGRLAEKWERLNDKTTRYFLRKGVKFHNGQEMKAEDVKYSLDLYAVPGRTYPYIAWLDKVTIVDPYTVDVASKTTSIVAVYDLCRAYIAPKAAREANVKAYQEKPIGSGPYSVVSWARGDRLTLKAFPDYWRGVAKPENLIFREITNTTTAAAELQSGGVDLVRNVDYILATQLKDNPALEVLQLKAASVSYPFFNVTQKPFDDLRVRQALNLAVDRQTLIDRVFKGFGVARAGPFPRGFLGYDSEQKPWAYDPAKAKSLLAEAGLPNGFKSQFGLSSDQYPSLIYKQLFEAMVSQIKTNTGVDLEITPYTGASRTCANMLPVDTGIWGVGFDATAFIETAYVQRACQHVPSVTAAWTEVTVATDLTKREAALKKFGREFQNQAIHLEILAPDFLVAKRKGINYQFYPYANGNSYQQYFDVPSLKPLT